MSNKKHKILLIDDDKVFAMTSRDALEAEGYETEHASDGKEGLLKVASWKPELILLDVKMPEMDGIMFLHELNKDKKDGEVPTPVFMMSNFNDMGTIEETTRFGIKGYIVKSEESAETMVELIKRYFENTGVQE